jgi:hypothetical protein
LFTELCFHTKITTYPTPTSKCSINQSWADCTDPSE